MRLLLAALLCLFVSPAFAQKASVSMKADDLQKAAAVAQMASEADKSATLADTATRIGIILQTSKGGPGNQGTIVVMPSDPEWATVVSVVRTLAAKRKDAAATQLDALGIALDTSANVAAKP